MEKLCRPIYEFEVSCNNIVVLAMPMVYLFFFFFFFFFFLFFFFAGGGGGVWGVGGGLGAAGRSQSDELFCG